AHGRKSIQKRTDAAVRGIVVHDDDLEVFGRHGRFAVDRVDAGEQQIADVPVDDDDRNDWLVRHAPEPPQGRFRTSSSSNRPARATKTGAAGPRLPRTIYTE